MAFSPLPNSLEEALKEVKMWRERHRQQRTWVGLTDDEIRKIAKENIFVLNAIIATNAKLKEKNT